MTVASNFEFLTSEWPDLFAESRKAEQFANLDPRSSCFYARRAVELAVKWLYQVDETLVEPYKADLNGLMYEPFFKALTGPISAKMNLIRKVGNTAVHENRAVVPQQALNMVRELWHVMFWLASRYAAGERPTAGVDFDLSLISKPGAKGAAVTPKTVVELQILAVKLTASDKALADQQMQNADLEAELAKLQSEVAEAKKANAATPVDHDFDEAATRDAYIDLLLREAGWDLTGANFEIEVTGMPNKGKGFVDYMLWGDDGKPLALIEAKRTSKSATVGQQQAKLYADCLETMHGQRPIIFYSNGYEHWIWDDTDYPPRTIRGFYTKDELELLIQRRTTRKPLADTLISTSIAGRPYQQDSVRRIAEAFERDHERKSLVVMATGAGKTRTVIALADLLMRTNWAKRILFLADRIALVNQAGNAFKQQLPDAPLVNLIKDKTTDGRVYVSTYPTMMGLINEMEDGKRRFGPGYFDLVVIDEAHRSVYQKYRAIFDYFDSCLVGLTATPKDEVDHNTYNLFELEDGVPTAAYNLDQAIAEGHLVPPQAMLVPLKFPSIGIRYDDLSEEEKDRWDEYEWSEDGDEAPDEVSADAVNKWLFNTDTVDKVLETLMAHGRKVAGGDRLGKTIIFAKNRTHAEFIYKRFNAHYPEYKGDFARIITYAEPYAQTLIDKFSETESAPHIAISVDMLDTGIDVPDVVNLLFFKPVRSKTKFWQMVGRGTRLRPDLYGPGQDKEDFLIFDVCNNIEFFSADLKTCLLYTSDAADE